MLARNKILMWINIIFLQIYCTIWFKEWHFKIRSFTLVVNNNSTWTENFVVVDKPNLETTSLCVGFNISICNIGGFIFWKLPRIEEQTGQKLILHIFA